MRKTIHQTLTLLNKNLININRQHKIAKSLIFFPAKGHLLGLWAIVNVFDFVYSTF